MTAHVRREQTDTGPVLHKEWRTPVGTLRASARLTDDWQPEDLPLYSDHLWGRGLEFLVKGPSDLAALDLVLGDPRAGDVAAWRERHRKLRCGADRLGVVLQGAITGASIYAMGLLGPKRAIMAVRDEPELFRQLLQRTQRWTAQSVELLLEAGVDVLYRSGCYETVDLFSPSDVREFFMPLLKEDVALCHQAGVPLHNFAQTGVGPFIGDYPEIGVDILSSLDTRGVNPLDLAEVKRQTAGRCCLMGGVDNRDPFITRPASDMESSVLEVLRVLAPGGGYILSTCGTIFPEGKEENVLAFIEAGLFLHRFEQLIRATSQKRYLIEFATVAEHQAAPIKPSFVVLFENVNAGPITNPRPTLSAHPLLWTPSLSASKSADACLRRGQRNHANRKASGA